MKHIKFKLKFNFLFFLIIFLITSNICLFSKGGFTQEADPEGYPVSSKLEKKKFIDNISQLYDYISRSYYEVPDTEEALNGALKGILENLGDPYSTYVTKEEREKYTESITGEFGGLGITIDEGLDTESGVHYIKVIAPIEGTPAFFAGIQSGDLIVSVDDKSTAEMSAKDAVLIMRGEPGTNVVLTIKRNTKLFPVPIKRDIIKVIYLKHSKINDTIGYISLLTFNDNTPEKFASALNDLEKDGYTHLILDLRNNPGGSLASVLLIADFFLDKEKLIVGTHSRIENSRQAYYAKDNMLISKDKKIIVLVNKGSASASEILAGALKFNDRATLVGENTFGKGLVQTVQPFGTGVITLTIAEYYTPGEHFINKTGIAPDIELLETEFDDNISERVWLSQISEEDLVRKFVEEKLGKVNEKEIEEFRRILERKGIKFRDNNFIARMLRIQAQRFNNEVLVYDLKIDSVLRSVVEMIETGKL